MIADQMEQSNDRMTKVMSLLESRLSSTAARNPIQERMGVMSNISASIETTEADPDLTPNSKSGLLLALCSEKKSIALEIIALAKTKKSS